VNEALASSSVSVTMTVDKLPSYPAVGDHALAYVGVTYGVTANGCYAVGWLQGGIWRGETPYDPDNGSAFLYVESQTVGSGYRLIKLANVSVPSTHTFRLGQVAGTTWGSGSMHVHRLGRARPDAGGILDGRGGLQRRRRHVAVIRLDVRRREPSVRARTDRPAPVRLLHRQRLAHEPVGARDERPASGPSIRSGSASA
jgi:hypothetical protein